MLIETYPNGVRMIEGAPNIVVSIRPDKAVVVEVVGVGLAHAYCHMRNLTPGQDPLPVVGWMLDALLTHLAARPAEGG